MAVEKGDSVVLPAQGGTQQRGTLYCIIVFALFIVVLLWYGYRRVSALPVPVQMPTVQAQRGDIDQTVAASGKLQLLKYADVGAQIPGTISVLHVALGDEVRSGKVLLSLAPSATETQIERNQAQLAQLRAELMEQQAQYDFAELQFKRQTQLKADNATREDAFEASRTAMSTAAARLDAINARIRQTEANVQESELAHKSADVVAPISGTVVMLTAHQGQSVGGPQNTLARIADLSSMTVQARVAESDVARVRKGMPAYFSTPAYPGKRWSGKVNQISMIPAEGSGGQGQETFYNVLFDVANPDRHLLSGMSAQVRIVVDRATGATLLPVDALGKADGDGLYTVQVVDTHGQLQQRRIRVGARDEGGGQVQVLSGVKAGERVAIATRMIPAAAASAR
jgi:membrane fusion protein, macrolide-specific efflux system